MMPTWTILWLLVFVAPNGYRAAPEFEQTTPVFETKEECDAYLAAMKPYQVEKFVRDFELPPGTKLRAEGMCKLSGHA